MQLNEGLFRRQYKRGLPLRVWAAGKKKKGKAGGKQGQSQSEDKAKFKTSGPVKQGSAYSQETRNIVLSLSQASKTAANGTQILKNVGFGMYLGAKIGILGPNGSGKTSMMKILAGVDQEFDGDLHMDPGIKIGYLPQEPVLDDSATVLSNIETAVKPVKDMLREFEEVSMKMSESDNIDALMARMDELQTHLDAIDGWEVDRQVQRALYALRCPPGDTKVEVLSGGERRRVAIASLVLERPQIIFLDEPTNHLDAESVAWLEHFLADFPGTVVAITHDRYFLDNVAGWIYELDRGNGHVYEGNYHHWLEEKDKRLQGEADKQSSLKKAIAAELEFVRDHAKGQHKAGRARLQAFEDLKQQATEYTRSGKLDSITIPNPPRLGSKVIEMRNVSKSFGDRLLIDNLSLDIPPGSIVGIIGGNGTGKSTLFKMILGQESQDSGEIEIGETVKIMYVDQSREALQGNRSVVEAIGDGEEEVDMGGQKVPVRQFASWFNFSGGSQQKLVKDLSGGERNRLHLASVLRQNGNVLLLDEPTNDLDVDTLRALEQALLRFPGTALIISHDRYFLDRICSHILAYEGDSKVTWFEGSYSEYEQKAGNKEGPLKFRKL